MKSINEQVLHILEFIKNFWGTKDPDQYYLKVVNNHNFRKFNFYIGIKKRTKRKEIQPLYTITDYNINSLEEIVTQIHKKLNITIKFEGFSQERLQETGEPWPKKI